jgi:hypothetical protein
MFLLLRISPTSVAIPTFILQNPSFIGYGAVKDSNGTTHDQIGYDNQGAVTTFQQIYISEVKPAPALISVGGQIVQTVSLNPTFPVGSLPLAVVVLDGVQRVQQVIDVRPSYLSSAPNLGSGMTESVADATRRVYFQNRPVRLYHFVVPNRASGFDVDRELLEPMDALYHARLDADRGIARLALRSIPVTAAAALING